MVFFLLSFDVCLHVLEFIGVFLEDQNIIQLYLIVFFILLFVVKVVKLFSVAEHGEAQVLKSDQGQLLDLRLLFAAVIDLFLSCLVQEKKLVSGLLIELKRRIQYHQNLVS